MADEIQASVPTGPNGERLEVKLGTRSFAFQARDLIPVLLVIAMVVGGYLVVQSIAERQDRGFKGQQVGFDKLEKLLELTHTNQAAMLAALRDNRDVTGAVLREQNTLLGQQTEQLSTNQAGIVAELHQQTALQRQWFATLLFKLQHPDQPVSIDIPLPSERGR